MASYDVASTIHQSLLWGGVCLLLGAAVDVLRALAAVGGQPATAVRVHRSGGGTDRWTVLATSSNACPPR